MRKFIFVIAIGLALSFTLQNHNSQLFSKTELNKQRFIVASIPAINMIYTDLWLSFARYLILSESFFKTHNLQVAYIKQLVKVLNNEIQARARSPDQTFMTS